MTEAADIEAGNPSLADSNPIIFGIIGQKLGGDQLLYRLKDNYSTLASISGLISGFVFVVTNQNIEWKNQSSVISPETRSNIVGSLFAISLLLSLTSTVVSVMYYTMATIVGADAEILVELINHTKIFVRLPTWALVVAILIMLFGSGIAIGGLYSSPVYYTYLTFSILAAIAVAAFAIQLTKYSQALLYRKLIAMNDFDKQM